MARVFFSFRSNTSSYKTLMHARQKSYQSWRKSWKARYRQKFHHLWTCKLSIYHSTGVLLNLYITRITSKQGDFDIPLFVFKIVLKLFLKLSQDSSLAMTARLLFLYKRYYLNIIFNEKTTLFSISGRQPRLTKITCLQLCVYQFGQPLSKDSFRNNP